MLIPDIVFSTLKLIYNILRIKYYQSIIDKGVFIFIDDSLAYVQPMCLFLKNTKKKQLFT